MHDPGSTEGSQSLRVLLANQDEARLDGLAAVLDTVGHVVVGRTIDLDSVAALAVLQRPDVALVAVGACQSHALEMVDHLVREACCPVIVMVNEPDGAFVSEAARRGVFAVLSDREPGEWQASLSVVLHRFTEYQNLQSAFTRRATIERASGILMERHSLDGEAAFAMLRHQARSHNRKLIDVASAVVDGHGLLPSTAT